MVFNFSFSTINIVEKEEIASSSPSKFPSSKHFLILWRGCQSSGGWWQAFVPLGDSNTCGNFVSSGRGGGMRFIGGLIHSFNLHSAQGCLLFFLLVQSPFMQIFYCTAHPFIMCVTEDKNSLDICCAIALRTAICPSPVFDKYPLKYSWLNKGPSSGSSETKHLIYSEWTGASSILAATSLAHSLVFHSLYSSRVEDEISFSECPSNLF